MPFRSRNLSAAENLLRLMANDKVKEFIKVVADVGWDAVEEVITFEKKMESRLIAKVRKND